MSIHEVVYDNQDRIIKAKCVDDQIKLATEKPEEVLSAIDGKPVVTAFHRLPNLFDVQTNTESELSIFPTTIHTITAETPDSVSEDRSILGFDAEGKLSSTVVSNVTFSGPEINANHPKTERGRGFVWTPEGESVDVFVAPNISVKRSLLDMVLSFIPGTKAYKSLN